MQYDQLLTSLQALTPIVRIRKALYEKTPSIVLPPPRTEAEIYHFISISAENNMPISQELIATLLSLGVYSGITTEKLVQLDEETDISAVQLPRYMWDCLHKHECFEVVCICNRNAQQIICDMSMQLQAGDVCIIAPGVQHDLNVFSDSVVIDLMIRRTSFNRSFFKLFSENDILYKFFFDVLYGGAAYPYILFRTGHDRRVTELILDVYQDSQQPQPYSSQYRFACVSMLFLHLLRCYSTQITVGNAVSTSKTSIVPILQFMQGNFDTVTRESVADAFHYNPSYLSRMIKKTTGQSFTELLLDIRLTKAQELLTNTTLSIEEITHMVGLNSVSNFHQLFRKKYNQSPGTYRKKNRILRATD